jgi:capsid protein
LNTADCFIVDPTLGVCARATPAAPAAGAQYESQPVWMQRHWEAAETTRLNEAHWTHAQDSDINEWLRSHLTTLRARTIYETRQNPHLTGIAKDLADDVVGPDGPQLQVLSDDDAYNEALEHVWRSWFAAPTFRPDLSGAAMLKLWVRNLPRCGEFVATIETDREAEGPVQMRLHPRAPRKLESPSGAGSQFHVLGVELDRRDRPVRYWFKEALNGWSYEYRPYPPDLVLHGFFIDEEGQARGFPWFTPALSTAADLRDYDDQVQDAARLQADQHGLLYTDHPDAMLWTAPETTTFERRTLKMAPPGWKPQWSPAVSPPVQYPDYRAERQRELGRSLSMPLLMVRLDSSKHNYSSARLDTQTYNRAILSIQCWLSGTPQSAGFLNRLVDLIGAEARFSVPALRRRPELVEYVWTWTPRPHVDPSKETDAETAGLESRTLSFTDALAARGRSLDTHMRQLARVERAFATAGVSPPAWLAGGNAASGPDAREARREQEAKDEGEAAESAEEEEAAANA